MNAPESRHAVDLPIEGMTCAHEGDRVQDYPDIPGTFLPFNDSIVHRAKESARYMKLSESEFKRAMQKELLEDVKERRRKRREALDADFEDRSKDFDGYAKRVLESISDVEMQEYLRSVGQRDRKTKPMVCHGADYPRPGV